MRDGPGDDYPDENRKMIAWMSGRSPEHRHFVATSLNWDFAEPALDWVVRQPDCDVATAVELFWLANPEESLCYPGIHAIGQGQGWVFEFLKYMVDRENDGQYRRRVISYNIDPYRPSSVEYYEKTEGEYRKAGLPWVAPRTFRVPFQGLTIADKGTDSEYWSEELRPLFEGLGSHFA